MGYCPMCRVKFPNSAVAWNIHWNSPEHQKKVAEFKKEAEIEEKRRTAIMQPRDEDVKLFHDD